MVELSRQQSLARSGRKLMIGAWGIEVVACLIGLAVALTLAADAWSRAGAPSWGEMALVAMPLVIVSAAELTKIPIAMAMFHASWRWKPIFFMVLAAMALITFETVFFGLDRNFALRTLEVENLRAQITHTERQLDALSARESEHERRQGAAEDMFAGRLTQLDERWQSERSAALAQLDLLDRELNGAGRGPQPPELEILQQQLMAKKQELDGLEGARRSELDSIQRNFEEQRDAYERRLKEALEHGDKAGADEWKRKLDQLTVRPQRREAEDRFNARRVRLEQESAKLEEAIRSFRFPDHGPDARRRKDLQVQRDAAKALLDEADRKHFQRLEALDLDRQEQMARSAGSDTDESAAEAQRESLRAEMVSLRNRLAELTLANQIYRLAANIYGKEPADVTSDEAGKIGLVWFGSLAVLAAIAGIAVSIAALVLDQLSYGGRTITPFDTRIRQALRRALIKRRWRRVRTVERPIEVPVEKIVEVPVVKVVEKIVDKIVEVPVENVVRELVHVPFFTDDPELLRRQLRFPQGAAELRQWRMEPV